jgi:hypothetical protein
MILSGKKRFISYLTVLAFLINAFVPFFAIYNIPQASAATQEQTQDKENSFFGDKILICTSAGFKWVSLDDLESFQDLEQQDDAPHSSSFECPLCYVAAHGLKDLLLNTDTTSMFFSADLSAELLKPADDILRAHFYRYTYQSRAPPTLS